MYTTEEPITEQNIRASLYPDVITTTDGRLLDEQLDASVLQIPDQMIKSSDAIGSDIKTILKFMLTLVFGMPVSKGKVNRSLDLWTFA